MNTPRLMTQTAFAKHRGVGRSAVSNYKSRGLLVFGEGEGGAVLVDVARTEARLNAKVDPTRGRPTSAQATGAQEALPLAPRAEPAGGGLGEIRTDLMRQQIIAATMKNAQAAGALVSVQEYERRSAELGRMTRERMHSLTRSLSERLASERDPRQITALLGSEIDRVFTDLADQVADGALTDDDDDAEIDAAIAAAEAEEAEDNDQAEAG